MCYFENTDLVSTISFAYKMYNYNIIETGFAYSNEGMV